MMITVNLRPGQKRKSSGGGAKAIVARVKDLAARVKDPLLAGVVAAWVLVAGWLMYTWWSSARELSRVSTQLESAQTEARRYETLMQQKRKAERIRDSLQTQIGVIRGVDRGRYVWPHIMDEVAKTLPPYTWLNDVSSQGLILPADGDSSKAVIRFQITGRTVDYQAFTQFLRQLEASPWIENVQTQKSETVVEAQRPVTSFRLLADFAQADSAYIRTVPLAQSVR